ncbi:MAG: class I SAM-dependent methyltransferase [Chitinophagaceae bacterium]|jgi:SAM-dependent methyltransferase|nr:class I SAM-dependent methyltransferase [Chitinophagaceae bacterium]
MGVKDLFSAGAVDYARFRPRYPKELLRYLAQQVQYRGVAWDCATGNGQLALGLEKYFNLVCATDISPRQILQAPGRPGIHYSVQPAENTDFPDHFFDLVTVGQAAHWLQLDVFYAEVCRVLRPGGVIALLGYGRCRVNERIDPILDHFYTKVVGSYWEPERRFIEEGYQTLAFPFEEWETPFFNMQESWSLDEMAGYLRTWSAVQKYKAENGLDPVDALVPQLAAYWPRGKRLPVQFPLLLRVGRR